MNLLFDQSFKKEFTSHISLSHILILLRTDMLVFKSSLKRLVFQLFIFQLACLLSFQMCMTYFNECVNKLKVKSFLSFLILVFSRHIVLLNFTRDNIINPTYLIRTGFYYRPYISVVFTYGNCRLKLKNYFSIYLC